MNDCGLLKQSMDLVFWGKMTGKAVMIFMGKSIVFQVHIFPTKPIR